MKILYLITKSELGGAQVHVAQLIRGMHERGHTVALMSYPGGWLEHEAKKFGATFFPNHFFANSYNPFRALRAMRNVRQAVERFKPDIVHLHSSGAGFLGRIAIFGKVPTVFTAHSWAFTDGAPLFRKVAALIAEKIASFFTTNIVCVSRFDYRLARRYRIASKKKLSVIYNAVTILPRLPQQFTHEKIEVIFLGRFAYPKKLRLLVDAYAVLPPEIKVQSHVTIIGNGPEEASLNSYIKERNLQDSITLLETTMEDARLRLANADIFILLSKHEGLPMTILEAMSCSLPVIASNVGGIPEEVDETTGILVENNIEAVARALSLLITDPVKRSTMGRRARERVIEDFSLERFLHATGEVYQEVVTLDSK